MTKHARSSIYPETHPDMLKKLIDLAPTLIPIIIAYFEVIGLFGNINLIAATLRRKHLRTKHGGLDLLRFCLPLCVVRYLLCIHTSFVNR